ncbi:fumarate hydratase [bacterium]|nr:fumarate hydratase [bacterium]
MRSITIDEIINAVEKMLIDSCINLPEDVKNALRLAKEKETDASPQKILDCIIQNAEIACEKNIPICQDTGITTVFVELGADVVIDGGLLNDAIQQGIRQGTEKGYLRRSIVSDPLQRKNTGDNTPGIIYIFPVAGDKMKITVVPKGGGCENMSRSTMLKPADGREGVKKFVVETVFNSGGNACPPMVIGVGLGGDFSYAPLLAKKSLVRKIGDRNQNTFYSELENEILEEINENGQGAQALGGKTTALDVFIETAPCHIASLPVAVCINCHAARHKSIVL